MYRIGKSILGLFSVLLTISACSDAPVSPSKGNSKGGMAPQGLISSAPALDGFNWGPAVKSERKPGAILHSDGQRAMVAWDNGGAEGWTESSSPVPDSIPSVQENRALARKFLSQLMPTSEMAHEQPSHDRLGIDSADGDVELERRPILLLARRASGLRVPDSFAFAQASRSGEITSFGFFWPELPSDTLAEALAVSKTLPGWSPKRKLLTPVSPPEVVILHGGPGGAALKWRVAIRIYEKAERIVYAVDHSQDGARLEQ